MHGEATIPETVCCQRSVTDIGNVETVLESLGASCYYLSVERNRYRFSLSPNLNSCWQIAAPVFNLSSLANARRSAKSIFGWFGCGACTFRNAVVQSPIALC